MLGVVVILMLDKGIEQAKWLTDDEKKTLIVNIAADASRVETDLGVYTLAACLSIGGLLVLALPKRLVNH